MKKHAIVITVTLLSLMFHSCSPLVTFNFTTKDDEVFTKQNLKTYFASHTKPAILLRTPGISNNISNSNPINTNQFYNYIERQFLKSGYTVRDRAIFEKVLTQSITLDYSKMTDLTNTDIILEVIGMQPEEYIANKYTKRNGNEVIKENCKWTFIGWKVDFRIIKVKENEVSGTYTFYKPPYNGSFQRIVKKKCLLVDPNQIDPSAGYSGKLVSSEGLEDFAIEITNKMINEMNATSK